VLDFGLVKYRNRPAGAQTLATIDYHTSGTPAYMAPEVILGGTDVDRRADVYALGCVAYYLLTGRQVFDGATVMEVMSKHLQTAPVPPSERASFTIPSDLEQLVLACLAKNPEERPRSAAALVRMLDMLTVEPWTAAQAEEWWVAVAPSGSGETDMAPPRASGDSSLAKHRSRARVLIDALPALP
jgi:serine/threonine protein kinase